jgi:hypothetical protein
MRARLITAIISVLRLEAIFIAFRGKENDHESLTKQVSGSHLPRQGPAFLRPRDLSLQEV